MNGISIEKILNKLDSHLHKNDYDSAERHLIYWLSEAESGSNGHLEITLLNELMGLYRKLGQKDKAISHTEKALDKVERLGIGHQVGAATTYLNAATVYKAFAQPGNSLPLFKKARAIYEKELQSNDERLGGLYNNMALLLVDLERYAEARELYERAIAVMEQAENGSTEVAITYLNIANALEAEMGLEESEAAVTQCLNKAQELLDNHPCRNGHYAFVCEKCASVYGYYGYFLYEKELTERARRIYEGN